MRKKRFAMNTISALFFQLMNLLAGFILPKYIIQAYGSEVNGLVSSITQFLTVVSLSEFGMTAVVQSSLYEPLARHDERLVNEIMTSASRFYKKVALVLVIYAGALCVIYPIIVDNSFSYLYISSMVFILSVNSLAQYLLGITNSQLLSADQKLFVTSGVGAITVLLNLCLCCLEIRLGYGIHFVKLTTAAVFLIRPFAAALYVRRHYNINRKVSYDTEPIKQKWNGVAQHLSYYVFNCTDIVVLSCFSTLENVSVYSVYAMVLNGLKQLCSLLDNSIKPVLGEFWALDDKEKFGRTFHLYEWFNHMLSIFVYGCATLLIVPFVKIYTVNVHDADYIVPLFAFIICTAYLVQNIKNAYNTLLQAVGHYKTTQNNYIIVAVMNIAISIICVAKYGVVGVAIGTLAAALYQLLWQMVYIYHNLLSERIINVVKWVAMDTLLTSAGIVLGSRLVWQSDTYLRWAINSCVIGLIWGILIIIVSLVFFRRELKQLLGMIKR